MCYINVGSVWPRRHGSSCILGEFQIMPPCLILHCHNITYFQEPKKIPPSVRQNITCYIDSIYPLLFSYNVFIHVIKCIWLILHSQVFTMDEICLMEEGVNVLSHYLCEVHGFGRHCCPQVSWSLDR